MLLFFLPPQHGLTAALKAAFDLDSTVSSRAKAARCSAPSPRRGTSWSDSARVTHAAKSASRAERSARGARAVPDDAIARVQADVDALVAEIRAFETGGAGYVRDATGRLVARAASLRRVTRAAARRRRCELGAWGVVQRRGLRVEQREGVVDVLGIARASAHGDDGRARRRVARIAGRRGFRVMMTNATADGRRRRARGGGTANGRDGARTKSRDGDVAGEGGARERVRAGVLHDGAG